MERVVEVCKVFGNGRIQLKKRVRVLLNVNDGDEVYFREDVDGRIFVEKVRNQKSGGPGRYVRSGS